MGEIPRTPHVKVDVNDVNLTHTLACLAIIARLITDWDYKLGSLPTWIGPNGEAEAMSNLEVFVIRGLLASLNGNPART